LILHAAHVVATSHSFSEPERLVFDLLAANRRQQQEISVREAEIARKDAEINALRAELKELRAPLSMNSRNSSKSLGSWFAVGTALSGVLPHRSQRAELPHWAPTLGTSVKARGRVWMARAGGWQPLGGETVHVFPVEARALAAAP
jgi:hypothetical protein